MPEPLRGHFDRIEEQARTVSDPHFRNREQLTLWMSHRTGIPADKVRASLPGLTRKFFNTDNPGDAVNQIAEGYKLTDPYVNAVRQYEADVETAPASTNIVWNGLATASSELVGVLGDTIGAGYSLSATALQEMAGFVDPRVDADGATGNIDRFWQAAGMAMQMKSEEYREIAALHYQTDQVMHDLLNTSPEFRDSAIGQITAVVGSIPATVVMAMSGIPGIVAMAGMFFGQKEQERMGLDPEYQANVKTAFENLFSAAPQVLIERAVGVERLFNRAWKVTPKMGDKVRLGDGLKNMGRRGLRSSLEEGIAEPLQGFWDDVASKLTYDEQMELVTMEAFKSRGVEAALGATAGFMFGTALSVDTDIQRNSQRKSGQNYLLTRQGGLLTPKDFEIMRSVYTDEEILAGSPDPSMGQTVLDAANGDRDAYARYQEDTAKALFEELGPSDSAGRKIGEVNGAPAIITEDGKPIIFNMADPGQADLWRRYSNWVSREKRAAKNKQAEGDAVGSVLRELQGRYGENLTVEQAQNARLVDMVAAGEITQAEMDNAIEVATNLGQLAEGMDPAKVTIKGSNQVVMGKNDLLQIAVRLASNSNPTTVIEEVGEGWLKQGIELKQFSQDEVTKARRAFYQAKGEADPNADQKNVARANTEWFSATLVDYALSKRKTILGVDVASKVGRWLKSLGDSLRSMLKGTAKMKKLMRDGKLDPKLESWMRQALGDPDALAEQVALDAKAAQVQMAVQSQMEREANAVALKEAEQVATAKARIDAQLDVQAQRMMEEEGWTDSSRLGHSFQLAPPTQTDAFKNWFGDSVVVNEGGQPKVMYHGTSKDADFKSFKMNTGVWLTSDPVVASGYATDNDSMRMVRDERVGAGPWDMVAKNTASRVLPVYAKIENPYVMTDADKKEWSSAMNYNKANRELIGKAKRAGHDGIKFNDDLWIAISKPSQIKSAIGNRGTFDPTKANITFSLASAGSIPAQSTDANATAKSSTVSDPDAPKDTSGADGRSRFRVSPEARGRSFHAALERTRKEHPQGAAVAVYDLKTYLDPENLLFQSEDQLGGVMVTSYGDLQSVHKVPGSTAKMKAVLAEASEYAATLDAFDIGGFLPNLYGQFKFVSVARVKFSREYAPDGWNYDTMGEPDVVFMVRDTEGVLKGTKPPTFEASEYEAAAAVQAEAKAKVAEAKAKVAEDSEKTVKPSVITFSMEEVSKPSDEYDASRVGTGTDTKTNPRTQTTNTSIDYVTPQALEKQMAMMTHFTKQERKKKKGVYKMVGVDYEMPSFITKHTDPVKRKNALLRMMVDNLLALHDAFPEEFRSRATHWYDGARIIADDMSSKFGMTPEQSGAIIAAFSPMKDWFQNVQMAMNFADVYANERNTPVTRKDFKKAIDQIANIPKNKKDKQNRAKLLKGIGGKSIQQLWDEGNQELAAWATRIVSTQKHGLMHDVLAPEGFAMGVRTNNDGGIKQMVWQDTSAIVKALKVATDGSLANISTQLGLEHKIRNFYNNIIAPNTLFGDATMDTHAVNADLLFPMGGSGYQVDLNFGKAGVGGPHNSGTYWLHLEAYKRAAAKRGLLPRQMQSITWEAVRMLFPDAAKRDEAFVDKYAQIWNSSSNASQARKQILSDGIAAPEWARSRDREQTESSSASLRKDAGYEAFGFGALRPTLRSSSSDGAFSPSVDQTFQLSGVPLNAEQEITFQLEALKAHGNLTDDTVIQKQQAAMTPQQRIMATTNMGFARVGAQLAVPISERLFKISPRIAQLLRRMEMGIGINQHSDLNRVKPFIDGLEGIKKDKAVYERLNLALMNGDTETRDAILAQFNLTIEPVESLLADIKQRMIDSGYEIGFIANYFPRKVKDLDALWNHYYGSEYGGELDALIRKTQKRMQEDGRTFGELEKQEVLNEFLASKKTIRTSGPSATKQRTTGIVTPAAAEFYEDSLTALISHINKSADAVGRAQFFGKHNVTLDNITDASETFGTTTDINQSIGAYVAEELADAPPGQAEEVRAMLEARFNQGVMEQMVRWAKTIGYITTMGQLTSTLTQLGDFAFSIYENGFFNTVSTAADVIGGNARVTRDQFNIETHSAEFASMDSTHKVLDQVFTLTGLKWMDRIGKETLMNGKINMLEKLARTGTLDTKSQATLDASFTPEQAAQVMEDLKAGNLTEDVQFLAYSTLADYQPINLSEFPEAYLRNPNGRIVYMLKTFTVKQLNAFWREGMNKVVFGKTPAERAQGMGNVLRLAALFWLIGVPVDMLKDWLMGREMNLSETAVDNIYKLGGLSNYHIQQMDRLNDPSKFIALYLAPPVPWFTEPAKGVSEMAKAATSGEEFKPGNLSLWRTVPVVGGFWYGHFGGGAERRRQESQKSSPTIRL